MNYYLLYIVQHIFIMIEVVHPLHSVLPYSDVIKHQAVHQTILHSHDDLLFPKDTGGDDADVLESYAVDVSSLSLPVLILRIRPGLSTCINSAYNKEHYNATTQWP